MIVFDIKCAIGHVFEAWFGSSADWDDQRSRGLVACPLCGSNDVEKAVMAPAVGAKGNQKAGDGAGPPAVPMSSGENPERMKQMLAALAKAQEAFVKDAEYVGDRFADEARGMHLGEINQRQIYGETSVSEAQSLIDEGISVAPLPLPMRRRSDA